MDADELTALRAQIAASTAAALAPTAVVAQDSIEAEAARYIIVADPATANNLIAQLTATRPTNTSLNVPTCCLTPGQISPDLILAYSNKTNITIYEKAITLFKLTFDGAISKIKIFMDDIIQRANDTKWYKGRGDVIHVLVDGTPMNVVNHYGCVSNERIIAHTTSWINRECRQYQNDQMMVKTILDHISKKVRPKITNQEEVILVGTPLVRLGSLILKLIMNKTIIDTRATSAAFGSDLSNLDSFMSSYNSNIDTFNTHVNHTVGILQARGERVDDLLTNLLKGYKIAPDVKFVGSIDLWESK